MACHTSMHEALKQFTKRHQSARCGNGTAFDAGGGFFGTLARVSLFVTNRTQRWSEGRQGQSEETQPCQTEDHRPKSCSSSLEKTEVTYPPRDLPACHNGGPSLADGGEKKICFSGRSRHNPTVAIGTTAKRLRSTEREGHRLGLALCGHARKTDSPTIPRQTRNADLWFRRHSPATRNIPQMERNQNSRGQLEYPPRQYAQRPANRTSSWMARKTVD